MNLPGSMFISLINLVLYLRLIFHQFNISYEFNWISYFNYFWAPRGLISISTLWLTKVNVTPTFAGTKICFYQFHNFNIFITFVNFHKANLFPALIIPLIKWKKLQGTLLNKIIKGFNLKHLKSALKLYIYDPLVTSTT